MSGAIRLLQKTFMANVKTTLPIIIIIIIFIVTTSFLIVGVGHVKVFLILLLNYLYAML